MTNNCWIYRKTPQKYRHDLCTHKCCIRSEDLSYRGHWLCRNRQHHCVLISCRGSTNLAKGVDSFCPAVCNTLPQRNWTSGASTIPYTFKFRSSSIPSETRSVFKRFLYSLRQTILLNKASLFSTRIFSLCLARHFWSRLIYSKLLDSRRSNSYQILISPSFRVEDGSWSALESDHGAMSARCDRGFELSHKWTCNP